MVLMGKARQLGLAPNPAIIAKLEAVVGGMDKVTKTRGLEAALLMFFDADVAKRVQYIAQVATAEALGNMEERVKRSEKPKRKAAKKGREPFKD